MNTDKIYAESIANEYVKKNCYLRFTVIIRKHAIK